MYFLRITSHFNIYLEYVKKIRHRCFRASPKVTMDFYNNNSGLNSLAHADTIIYQYPKRGLLIARWC